MTDYGFPSSTGTFAGTYKDRRSMIFFGANDGMVHAVDARTGYEVWAFIPYNLLPKLGALLKGQSVEQFNYFVDSSPKIAEVKMGGTWRSMLIIGQAYGGTFYQAFDVTNAGMGVTPTTDGMGAVTSLSAQFDSPDESIQFKWAFPNYSSFDPNVSALITLTDGFPGGRIRFYGDLKITATDAERSVGFTFSDPAVGALDSARTVNAVITGSGYFPDVETNSALVGRASSSVRAGRSFYLIDLATGKPIGNPNGPCSSSGTGTGCLDLGDVNNQRKNALQADVTAAGDANSNVVLTAYAGDIDGRYRRFNLQSNGSIASILLHDAGQPIYASSALLFVGTTQRYLFFSTGSDILAASAPGGGSNGSGESFKLLGVRDNTTSGTVTVSRTLSPAVKSTGLLTNGERPTNAPTVAGDIVFFTTTTDSDSPTCSDALTKVYAFTYLGTAAYDSDGIRQGREQRIARSEHDGRTGLGAVHRRSAPATSARRRSSAPASRCSAIRRTSTTAPVRSACASCPGEKSDDATVASAGGSLVAVVVDGGAAVIAARGGEPRGPAASPHGEGRQLVHESGSA